MASRRGRKPRAPLSQYDVARFEEVIKYVKFERASFSCITGAREEDGLLPKNENEVTGFIKKRTRLYMQSWVLPVLEEMVARGRGEDR